MPGLKTTIPPPPFHSLCERWANGSATPQDTAVLTALQTSTPLPPSIDPIPFGFDPTTRLPPPSTVHLYHAAKNAARATFHANQTQQRNQLLLESLNTPPSNFRVAFPKGLGAAPARRGLAEAAASGVGRGFVATWKVPWEVVAAAGVEFVQAVKGRGWDVEVDEEGGVIWSAGEQVSDWELVALVDEVSKGVDRDVIGGGVGGIGERTRRKVGGIGGMWLKVRLRIAFASRVHILGGVTAVLGVVLVGGWVVGLV